MRITSELNLVNFEFWAGAKDFADRLTYNEVRDIECILEDIFCNKIPSDTEINDLFWFDDELICEWLNLDIETIYNR